ncbi:hypothetical protein Sjap_022282 [Stephania japonica]|uniref:Uncharacterized protein n=1 Tax=Stephania japonica TaxID=461633 RepID=A0AAP0ER83_9MAGN
MDDENQLENKFIEFILVSHLFGQLEVECRDPLELLTATLGKQATQISVLRNSAIKVQFEDNNVGNQGGVHEIRLLRRMKGLQMNNRRINKLIIMPNNRETESWPPNDVANGKDMHGRIGLDVSDKTVIIMQQQWSWRVSNNTFTD